MPIVDMNALFKSAKERKNSIGAFNIFNHLSALSVVNAAERLNSPVIIQTSMGTVKYYGIEETMRWLKPLCEHASVPIVINLDHCTDEDFAYKCVDAGWTCIMFDGSHYPLAENIEITKRIVDYAHSKGAFVEGEVGVIKGIEEDIISDSESLAKFEDIQRFINETGVDSIAPSLGTAHGIYKGVPVINYDLINRVVNELDCYLVIHGGSGLSEETYQKLVMAGVSKINISTNIKDTYVGFFKEHHTAQNPLDFDKEMSSRIEEVALQHMSTFSLKGGL
jgi:fructose-bisphosphate aldolase class II